MTESAVGFAHINLNEVDPAGMSPQDNTPYQFRVTKATEVEWSNTEKGTGGTAIDMAFTIVNSENFSGKTFYSRLFPDKPEGKQATTRRLAILKNVTGVTQSGSVADLLTALVDKQGEFESILQTQPARGEYKPKQEVNLFAAKPIS